MEKQTGKEKRTIAWGQLFFSGLWFLGAALILILYLTDQLSESFPVPRIIGWIYDLFGVVAGSLVQLLVTTIGIVTSFQKKKLVEEEEDADVF